MLAEKKYFRLGKEKAALIGVTNLLRSSIQITIYLTVNWIMVSATLMKLNSSLTGRDQPQ
jgi:hypothetical protein